MSNSKSDRGYTGSGMANVRPGDGDVGPLTLPEWDKADSAAQYTAASIIANAKTVQRGGNDGERSG